MAVHHHLGELAHVQPKHRQLGGDGATCATRPGNDHVASSLDHATQHRDVEGQELIDSPEDQVERTAAHHQKNA
ncbi:hypothetical protein E1292_49085 [Nonomuraea deserti]|uniref:Uncharacterized protein n=1 Tax=Nonomuraea deserti TaxID=1848322 RepID=A0A4R4U8E4_9ACTN|nr:hypothetical protein E1292_49085 [Nonomuraea deserti]